MSYRFKKGALKRFVIALVIAVLFIGCALAFVLIALPQYQEILKKEEIGSPPQKGGYESAGMKMSFEEIRQKNLTYFIAKVKLYSADCVSSAFAKDRYGAYYLENPLEIAVRKNAVLAICADCYGDQESGVVIRNGKLYRDVPGTADMMLIYSDGSMRCISPVADAAAAQALLQEGVKIAYSCGEGLILNGKTKKKFSEQGNERRARTGVGYTEDGEYIIIIADEDSSGSIGITLSSLTKLFSSYGCTEAYALNSGASAVFIENGKRLNAAGGRKTERKVNDILCFSEVASSAKSN